jgi:hypothetical protein
MRRRGTRRPTRAWALVAVSLVVALGVPLTLGSASAQTAELSGHVRTGANSLGAYTVTLYATNGAGAPTTLGTTTSAADGSFDIPYAPGTASNSVLYVLATNTATPPNPGAAVLASVLGPGTPPVNVTVNELTTVAAGYAMAQFTRSGQILGPSPGLQNAAGMVRDLVDPVTGSISSVLANPPNVASSIATFNSLANMLAACVAAQAQCTQLFTDATPTLGAPPADTLQAVVNINHNPGLNVAPLFALSQTGPQPYSPALTTTPDAWTLALRFVGDGTTMSGPGNMAVDANGNIWVTNNYLYDANPSHPVCGSDLLLEFTPTGQYVAGSPWRGGGLNGAGFGIDIDPFGDIWASNFGFAAPAPGCPTNLQPPHNSVSEFSPTGQAISPDATATFGGGFTQGNISWPQGLTADQQGNIWTANCQANSVTEYPGGSPNAAAEITNLGIVKPFGATHNTNGVFVTGVGSDNVAMIRPDGTPAPGSPIGGGGMTKPLGIAADSRGNLWVANSGLVDVPCPDRSNINSFGGSLTLLDANGHVLSPTGFTGGGLTIPWGVTTDGNDNVWVANFGQQRLSEFCGTQPATCPAGLTTGQAISPASTGYGFDGLVRNTGVVVDPSGNVWLANNWKQVPPPTNPGGFELVAFVGLASPVQRAAPRPRPQPVAPVVRFTG